MLKAYLLGTKNLTPQTLSNTKKKDSQNLIVLTSPTKNELDTVTKQLDIPLTELKLCLDQNERARIEQRDGYSIIILKIPTHKKEHISTTTLALFLIKNHLMILTPEKTTLVDQFLTKPSQPEIFTKGRDAIIYELMFAITREFNNLIITTEEKIDKLETKILNKKQHSIIHETLAIKKSILYLRKAINDNRIVSELLESGATKELRNRHSIHNLFIENLQLSDLIAILAERVTSLTELSMEENSYRINSIMKVFTIIAAVLLLPTIISGIYGMNLTRLPLATHPQSFWILILIMAASIALALLLFKLVKWM